MLALASMLTISLCTNPVFADQKPADSAPTQCPPSGSATSATVKYVTDGDSIRLLDGRRVRIIGLNAPELQPEPQPFARQALARARELLRQSGHQVTLVPGAEPRDRHGRFLFHVQLPDGRLLAEALIREGLAVQSAVAPNTACAERLNASESTAREHQLGIWSDDSFWRRSFRQLKSSESGFRLVQDRVVAITRKQDSATVTLKHGLLIHISLPMSLHSTDGRKVELEQLQDRMIEVRGWLFRSRGQHQLKLHSAANLRIDP